MAYASIQQSGQPESGETVFVNGLQVREVVGMLNQYTISKELFDNVLYVITIIMYIYTCTRLREKEQIFKVEQ